MSSIDFNWPIRTFIAIQTSPSTDGHHYNDERDDNTENFVAAVGSQDSYDSRKQQNKSNGHNGEDNWRLHVKSQSFVSGALRHFVLENADVLNGP